MTSEVAVQEPPAPRAQARSGAVWPVIVPAVIVLVVSALDLAGRQIARLSLLQSLTGVEWEPASLLVGVGVVVCVAVAALAFGRRRRHPRAVDAAVLLLLAGALNAGLVAQLAFGARLQSDGFYYYAYLRSLWFDGDVDFTNDYRVLGLGNRPHLFEPTRTGHAPSAWTIGPAMVWSPFFGIGHLVAGRLAASGADVAVDGTSAPYRQAVCVAGLFYGLLGTFFLYRMARYVGSSGAAVLAAVAVVAGSFEVWYLVKEPTMTHAPSMAAVAAFGWLWLATRGHRSLWHWVALGLLAGLMGTIRWQNVLFALIPALEALTNLWKALGARDRLAVRREIVGGVVFTAAAVIGFLPQMVAWKAIYGSWLAVSPLGPQIRWWAPHVVDILWSSRNGLFSWSPILYIAAVGLIVLAVRDRRLGLPVLAAIVAMVYFNASIQDWWGSASFGMRRFDSALPFFALGLTVALEGLRRLVASKPGLIVGSLVAALLLWNAALVKVAVSGATPIGETVSFGSLAGAQVVTVHGWLGYPFSYPANLLFAIRNGLSPARYDRLGPSRFLGDPARPYGRLDIGLGDDDWLLGGWHGAEQEGPVTFRWAEPTAVAAIPLDHPEALSVRIRLRPFTASTLPPQQLTVSVGGRRFGPFPLEPGWQEVRFDTPREAWRGGVNRLSLTFAYGARPSEVGLGGDTRLLSAAIDWVRIQAAP